MFQAIFLHKLFGIVYTAYQNYPIKLNISLYYSFDTIFSSIYF